VSRIDEAALQTLARELVRKMTAHRYDLTHIIAVASELIGIACEASRSNLISASEAQSPQPQPEEVDHVTPAATGAARLGDS
jgi:hypothetical protein